ncbi:hypothetical protein K7432_009324 [Basidiobolus ranarum]|uniref:Cyclin N-terminal domain-containing protein n=1 Tax=Basidiobolus ranarum TaxID=34480 RepID=A0ABR2VX78_9FUNG
MDKSLRKAVDSEERSQKKRPLVSFSFARGGRQNLTRSKDLIDIGVEYYCGTATNERSGSLLKVGDQIRTLLLRSSCLYPLLTIHSEGPGASLAPSVPSLILIFSTVTVTSTSTDLKMMRTKTIGNTQHNPYYKPLPPTLINFTAESMCGLLNTKDRPLTHLSLPELLLFIERVTERSRIDAITGVVALIYIYRLKVKLPRTAQGEYGTSHRIFLASLLVASKFLYAEWGLSSRAIAEISGVFTNSQVNLMELEFLRLLDYDVWVNDIQIKKFLENYKSELCFF